MGLLRLEGWRLIHVLLQNLLVLAAARAVQVNSTLDQSRTCGPCLSLPSSHMYW